MITHVWTVLCTHAVVDRDSNNVSIQNVLEQITVDAEPAEGLALPLPHETVTLWIRTDPEVPAAGRMRLRLVGPSGREFASHEQEIDLTDHEGFRSRNRFRVMPLMEEGQHWFRVDLRTEGEQAWQEVAAVPLRLRFRQPVEEESVE